MIISLDTEYTEKNIRKAELLSVSIGFRSSEFIFNPTLQKDCLYLQNCLNDAKVIFVQNGVVDWYMLTKNGFNVDFSKFRDCMLMEHLIDENLEHGLGAMALRYANDNYKDDFWSIYKSFQEAPPEIQEMYEHKDARYTYDFGVRFLEKLSGKQDLLTHVHKLQFALFQTEVEGLLVNKSLIEETKLDMSAKISSYLEKLRGDYNEYCQLWEINEWGKQLSLRKSDKGKLGVRRPTFKFTSDTQIRWLVYDAMECPILEKTKKGAPKTDYETLKKLSETYPELQTLVDYKDIKAVYATFVEGMLDRVEADNRIYPTFFINGTATGRISHANPNMGNLPTTGPIRSFFIPGAGNRVIGADYSQLEVVVEANLTEDASLLKIILEGASKHDITAQGLGISRDQAKTLNFALQYGAGVRKVSKILNLSLRDAQDVFDRYWDLYSGVKALKARTIKELEQNGCVTNLFGRTRHFAKATNPFEKEKQIRQAYNFKIQGVGADITNMATYRIADRLKRDQLGRLWFSVHDEIIAEVKEQLAEQGKAAIVQEMEGVNDYINFKYRVGAKPYGPFTSWRKA